MPEHDAAAPRRPAPVCFAVCDPGTGAILRVGHCAAPDLPLQARAGEVVIETDGTVDDLSHYLQDGGLRPIPPAPGPDHCFDRGTGTWRPDPAEERARLARARAEAQAEVIALIDARAETITGGVPLVERLSWGPKEAAARALLAGTPGPQDQAMIAAEARLRGEAPQVLARRIVARADQWRALAAELAAHRHAAAEAIDRATGEDALAEALTALAARLDRCGERAAAGEEVRAPGGDRGQGGPHAPA